MATLNIQIEMPNTGTFNVKELERRLTEYARSIVLRPTTSETTNDKKNLYISPLIKELETGFVCPDDMSHDYKEEISQLRTKRFL